LHLQVILVDNCIVTMHTCKYTFTLILTKVKFAISEPGTEQGRRQLICTAEERYAINGLL